jgi:WD40 repeat protein
MLHLLTAVLSWTALIEEPKSVQVFSAPISRVVFSRDGKRVAVGGSQGDIAIFTAGDWTKAASFKPGGSRVVDIEFSPDGTHIAIASQDKSIRVAKSDGTIVRKFDSDGWGMGASFSPDGKQLAGVFADGIVRVWDIVSGNKVWEKQPSGMKALMLRWHPKDSKILMADPSGWLVLLDAKNGNVLAENKSHAGTPQFIAFSADGTHALASHSRGGNTPALALMDATSAATKHNFESLMVGGSLAPDNSRIVGLGGDGELRVFDVSTKSRVFKGDPIRKFRFFKAEQVAVSPDGKTALISGDLSTAFGFYVVPVESLK